MKDREELNEKKKIYSNFFNGLGLVNWDSFPEKHIFIYTPYLLTTAEQEHILIKYHIEREIIELKAESFRN